MFGLFKPKPTVRIIPPIQVRGRVRFGDLWDVAGDGRFQIHDASSNDVLVTLFHADFPWRPPGSNSTLFMKASLLLYRQDGWYTFKKDRSGGMWTNQLIAAGLIDAKKIIYSEDRTMICCPLSEAAIRTLSLMV
jgi:hypothetical protein